jgi:hypothetical protein
MKIGICISKFSALFLSCALSSVLATLTSCTSPPVEPIAVQRLPAGVDECGSFNKLSAAEKLKTFMDRHASTAIEPDHAQMIFDNEALAQTARFLSPAVPGSHETFGHGSLDHTLSLACDTLVKPQVKMVHAIGTLAQGHLLLYPRLKKLNPSGIMTEEVDSPWTGLFDPVKNDFSVPLLVRFSIANPLFHSLEIAGKSLSLEFIPGLGLKFLINGQKSIDLLAMESLAGQGLDHNYFKYEFSPDFSAHAPPEFNTAPDGDAKSEILERYEHNPVNERVMGWVGERFFEAMKGVYGLKDDQLDRHAPAGPNPFIISLQGMSRVDKTGRTLAPHLQKRPWRLVLRPALDNIEGQRLDQIRDSTAYSVFHKETDFRAKLSHLQAGDRIFYVLAETRVGERYTIGEIVLDSAPFASEFADREFFLQHEIEFDRSNGSASVTEP